MAKSQKTTPAAGGWWLAAISLVGLAAYWNSLNNPFVYDEVGFLQNNPAIHHAGNLLRLWTRDYYAITAGAASYRPIGAMMWVLDGLLFGNNVFGFNLSNLLLHLANAYLVFRIGAGFFLSDEAAGWAGLLFAVHPVHAGPVNCVAFNGDLLATLFILLAMGSYLKLCRDSRHYWRQAMVALWLGAALLSKETALMFLPALFLYESLDIGAIPRARLKIWIGLCGITAVYLGLRFGPLRSPLEAGKTYIGGSLAANLMTISQLPMKYLWLLVYPNYFSVYHDVTVVTSVAQVEFLSAAAFLVFLAWLLYCAFFRSRRAFFFAAWIILGLLPAMNLIPFANLRTLFAARFLYLPSVGFCWLAAQGWERLRLSYKRTARLLATLAILLCSISTYARNKDWSSEEKLFNQAIPNAPFLAGFQQGSKHLSEGRPEAAQELALALPAAPDEDEAALVRNDLAVALERLWEHDKAVALLVQSLEKGRREARLYANLGTIYYRMGQYRLAARYLEHAAALEPHDAGMHFNLSLAEKKLKNYARAAQELRWARRINPGISDTQFWITVRQ